MDISLFLKLPVYFGKQACFPAETDEVRSDHILPQLSKNVP